MKTFRLFTLALTTALLITLLLLTVTACSEQPHAGRARAIAHAQSGAAEATI